MPACLFYTHLFYRYERMPKVTWITAKTIVTLAMMKWYLIGIFFFLVLLSSGIEAVVKRLIRTMIPETKKRGIPRSISSLTMADHLFYYGSATIDENI